MGRLHVSLKAGYPSRVPGPFNERGTQLVKNFLIRDQNFKNYIQ